MGFFIGANGYYEGDRAHVLDKEVPQRPSPDYKFSNGMWVLQPDPLPQNADDLVAREQSRLREEIAARIEAEPLSEGTREILRSFLELTDKGA